MIRDMGRIEDHQNLPAWQKAIALATKVYAATRALPNDERSGLGAQMRQAAVAIPSHVAEGAARNNRVEFVQHLQAARSSLAELETQMMIAVHQGYLSADEAGLRDLAEVSRCLNHLISKLVSAQRDAHANACRPPHDRRCRTPALSTHP